MASSTLGDILEAVKTTITALDLPDIASNVLLKKFPWRRDDVATPAVLIAPQAEQLPNLGTNASDDTGYGVQVVIVRVSNNDLSLAGSDQLLAWRDAIIKAFREKRISGIAGSYHTTIEPGPMFDQPAFWTNYDASTLLLRAWVREARP